MEEPTPNLENAAVGIKRCASGWHAFVQFERYTQDDLYAYFGPHRDTEDEATQDAWNEMQRRIKEAKEVTGVEQTPTPRYTVN